MNRFTKRWRAATRLGLPVAACLLALAAAAPGPTLADNVSMGSVPPRYTEECGSCHAAYPPGLLPAASWQRLMNDLPRHFGSDASLEPAVHVELSKWLATNAGTFKKTQRETAPPEDRITRSSWFVREHHDVSAAVWQRKAIGSAANCVACHSGAAQGRFSEHDVRIPK